MLAIRPQLRISKLQNLFSILGGGGPRRRRVGLGGGNKPAMEGQESENPHLVLSHNLFLLTHSDVPDIEKVSLKYEVLSSIKSDYMVSLYEHLASTGVLNVNRFQKLSNGNDEYLVRSPPRANSDSSRNVKSAPWRQDSRIGNVEATNGDTNSGHAGSKTREERLIETIVISGGVRLQPTRDALHAFLMEASKMDALALCYALDSKLQSPLWQI